MMLQSGWILAVFLAAWAGVRWIGAMHHIPNWLTVRGWWRAAPGGKRVERSPGFPAGGRVGIAKMYCLLF